MFDIIHDINKQGTTILVVEQNANQALSIADRGYVLETGQIVLADTAAALLKNPQVREAYLGEGLTLRRAAGGSRAVAGQRAVAGAADSPSTLSSSRLPSRSGVPGSRDWVARAGSRRWGSVRQGPRAFGSVRAPSPSARVLYSVLGPPRRTDLGAPVGTPIDGTLTAGAGRGSTG